MIENKRLLLVVLETKPVLVQMGNLSLNFVSYQLIDSSYSHLYNSKALIFDWGIREATNKIKT
jgi:hypothetical protein